MNDCGNETLDTQQNLARVIDELLSEREQVLVTFCRVAAVDDAMDSEARRQLLQRFCEILVDYSALWHFEIFRYLKEHRDEYPHAISTAVKHEVKIVQASEDAVVFNDKYDPANHDLSFEQLDHDLSVLGEALAARIDAEDQILSAMVVD